ncbi:hypothetical protein HNQ59_003061 [Chitinivorax tropicus]|uniref:Uncharacterized protein n=1 Tax=Chitinivorax tropicus TaxID=714531 RepID=A0A840MTX9_9PROT|nr:hypothetical protein [Chitinivorax tropicus]MBB5019753.1 hypothetical protein [Chitinivorax tropicus]
MFKKLSSLFQRPATTDESPVGHVMLNGEKVAVRHSQWPNLYALGDSGKLNVSRTAFFPPSNGCVDLQPGQVEPVARLYREFLENRAVLLRGISSTHFSWNGVVGDGIVKSGGDADIPEGTMTDNPDEPKTRWLPSALESDRGALEMVSGICLGNHNATMRGAMAPDTQRDDVLLGAMLRFEAGVDRNLAISYLYDGEIVVRGPLERDDFTISHLVVSDSGSPSGYSSVPYGGTEWDDDLGTAAPYDVAEQDGEISRERTRMWMDESVKKMASLRQSQAISPVPALLAADRLIQSMVGMPIAGMGAELTHNLMPAKSTAVDLVPSRL